MSAAPGYSLALFESAPFLAIAVLLLGLMALAFIGGRELRTRLARRRALHRGSRHGYEGYIMSGVLGLLAILVGLTFLLSISRYEQRRELVISHANAIETAYLRAQLLGAPHRERLGHLLTIYNDNLIELASARPAQVPILFANDSVILTEIWAATAAAIDSVRSIPLSLALTESVNRITDLDASRRALLITRIPTAVFVFLLVCHVGAAGALGYLLPEGAGQFARGSWLILMSLALLLIIDINRPASGWIRPDGFPSLQVRDFIKTQPPAVFDRWRNESELALAARPDDTAQQQEAQPEQEPQPQEEAQAQQQESLPPPSSPRAHRPRTRARDGRRRQ